jgi:hypothetical protein
MCLNSQPNSDHTVLDPCTQFDLLVNTLYGPRPMKLQPILVCITRQPTSSSGNISSEKKPEAGLVLVIFRSHMPVTATTVFGPRTRCTRPTRCSELLLARDLAPSRRLLPAKTTPTRLVSWPPAPSSSPTPKPSPARPHAETQSPTGSPSPDPDA